MGGHASGFRDDVALLFQAMPDFQLVIGREFLVFQAELDGRLLVGQHSEEMLARGQEAPGGGHFRSVGHFFVVQFILQKRWALLA